MYNNNKKNTFSVKCLLLVNWGGREVSGGECWFMFAFRQ